MLEQVDDFLTVAELCEVLKIGQNAAYTLLNSGTIKAIKNGRVWRIPKWAIINYTYEMTKTANPAEKGNA